MTDKYIASDFKSHSIRYSNYLALLIVVSIFTALLITFCAIDPGYFRDVIKVTASTLPLWIISWYYNYKEKFFISGIIINLTLTVFFFVLSGVFFDRSSYLHYYFLLFALIPLFTFKSERIFLIGSLMMLNLFCFIYVDFFKPEGDSLLIFPALLKNSFRIISISLLFLFTVLIIVLNQCILRMNEILIKRQTEEIARQNEELSDLISTKDRFFSSVSQDLKGPVGTVSAFLDYLADSAGDLTSTQFQESLDVLKRYSRDIYNLFDNILTWSRIQSGDIVFDRQKHNLNELVNSTVKLFVPMMKQKNITLVNRIKNLDSLIPFDKEMMKTVLRNILDNAIKFSEDGGEIIISVKNLRNHLEFSVSDKGVGMDKETLEGLFSIDVAHNNRLIASTEKGSGLGLILCKEFIEKHGGALSVESEKNRGTKVTFTLPLDL